MTSHSCFIINKSGSEIRGLFFGSKQHSFSISVSVGTFGPKEDLMFNLASKYARARKIPRIYLSANSGARIGIATELLSLFRVAWEIKDDPEKGFKYLYLSPDEYQGQAHDIFSRIFRI